MAAERETHMNNEDARREGEVMMTEKNISLWLFSLYLDIITPERERERERERETTATTTTIKPITHVQYHPFLSKILNIFRKIR